MVGVAFNSYDILDLVLLNVSPEKRIRPFGPGTAHARLHYLAWAVPLKSVTNNNYDILEKIQNLRDRVGSPLILRLKGTMQKRL